MRTTEKLEPGYWAVIPAQVRYAPEIPAGAKLLYGEISSLTDQRGYCYASNAYFAELYGVGVRTVQRWLDALKSAGLIRIADDAGGSDQRKIYAGVNPLAEPATEMSPPHDKNVMAPMTEMSRPHDKNVAANKNNKKEIKKEEKEGAVLQTEPKAPMPKDLMDRVASYAGADPELHAALIGFAEMRAKRKKPIDTQRILTLLLSRLNELSKGSRRAKLAIIDKATVSKWLSFYPLDGDELPSTAERTVEAPPGVATW